MISPLTSPMVEQSHACHGDLTRLFSASPTSLEGRVISAARYKVGIRRTVEIINYSLRTLETPAKSSHLATVVASKVVSKQTTSERAEIIMG